MANIVTRSSCFGKKSIYVFHSTIKTFSANKTRLFRMVLKWFFKNRKVVCVSKGIMSECLNEYKFSEKNIKAIYNPINIEEIKEKSKQKLPNGVTKKPYFIIIGRLNRLKRQDRCIEIFNKGDFYKKYDLLICGTGELEQELRKQAGSLPSKESIKFIGWQENVYKWMKNSALVLCTSDAEGFPMNMVEAYACGAKVVSSDCDFGPREIMVGEYSKYLVDKDSIGDYIETINDALNKYPKTKNPIVAECSIENIMLKYESFYKEAKK